MNRILKLSKDQRLNTIEKSDMVFPYHPELLEWLNQERWNDGDGNPETNSALVIRKLNKLMKLENEGY